MDRMFPLCRNSRIAIVAVVFMLCASLLSEAYAGVSVFAGRGLFNRGVAVNVNRGFVGNRFSNGFVGRSRFVQRGFIGGGFGYGVGNSFAVRSFAAPCYNSAAFVQSVPIYQQQTFVQQVPVYQQQVLQAPVYSAGCAVQQQVLQAPVYSNAVGGGGCASFFARGLGY